MTFQELRVFASSLLDDTDNGYFTTGDIDTWINFGQRKVQRKLVAAGQGFYFKCVSATLTTNSCSLVLPQDFQSVHKVRIITGGAYPREQKYDLDEVSLNEASLIDSEPSNPVAWYLHKNLIKVVPVPDVNYRFQMVYSYQVADMTDDNEVPDVPERYHELIGIYGAMYGYIKDDRSMVQLKAMESDYIEELEKDAQQRNRQNGRRIRETGYVQTYYPDMF